MSRLQFDPLNQRLQTISAAFFMFIFPFGGPLCLILSMYMLFFTKLWWICFFYFSWLLIMDRNIEERGGRNIEWFRSWTVWKYYKDYFPATLNRAPWVELEPQRNYLFCCFPHGVISAGPFTIFGSIYGEFNDYFPNHKVKLCTLKQNFYMPFFRELILGLGACSASEKSIEYLLNHPKGGNAVALIVGGVAESYYCEPQKYKLVLKNRKGFVKIAMKNGSPLVPVFTFGETDIFDQYGGKDSKFKKYQEKIRDFVGIAPILSSGSFGLIPHRKKITMLVGSPIEVDKNENPTIAEINNLHKYFIEKLTQLFEENKGLYLENSEDIHVEII